MTTAKHRVAVVQAATVGNRTAEGRCFALSCNQFARASDYPERAAVVGKSASRVHSRGGSRAISPLGEILAGPNYEGECILTAELDAGDIARGKFDFDAVGHYARPDVFRLVVEENPKLPVVFRKEDA